MKHIRLTVYPHGAPAWTLDAIARSTCDAICFAMETLGFEVLITARVVLP